MPIQVHIRTDPELGKLIREFDKFPETLAGFLRSASEKSAFELEGQAKKFAPVDTGRLRASIGTSLGIVKNIGAIVQTNVNYAAFVHEGTKPHFPPISALEGWAKRHNLSALAVATSISRRGTKARPFMRKAAQVKQGDVTKIYQDEILKGLQYMKSKL